MLRIPRAFRTSDSWYRILFPVFTGVRIPLFCQFQRVVSHTPKMLLTSDLVSIRSFCASATIEPSSSFARWIRVLENVMRSSASISTLTCALPSLMILNSSSIVVIGATVWLETFSLGSFITKNAIAP